MKKYLPSVFSLVLIMVLVISFLPGQTRTAYAVSPDVVISQVYGGGGNSGAVYTNDFVELYNRGNSTVSLGTWSIQYASASGTGNFGANSGQITPLSGSIDPGEHILIQEAAGSSTFAPLPGPDITDSTPINMSATDGKVALVTSTTSLGCNGGSTLCSDAQKALIRDLVGYGNANFYEGTAAPAASNSTALLRKGDGAVDTDDNSADFDIGAPNPRSTGHNPYGAGAATPDTVIPGVDTLLTVMAFPATVPPSTGLKVSCNVSAIGGALTQTLFDDGTNGDAAAGDNTFSYFTTVAIGTSLGAKSLPCSVADDQGRVVSAPIALTVTAIKSIGSVNGPVTDTEDATKHRSPFAASSGNGVGSTAVVVKGVIYEKTLQAISGTTDTYKGFFIQNTAATADGVANTSDGLFVFMNTADTLPTASGPYTPNVGDEVIIAGRISEYYNMTEMQSPSLALLSVVRSGADGEIASIEANPPTALADANRYWERMQGMRVQVPQSSIVLGGRNVFSPADAEVWVARSDSVIAQRSNEYARRAFRDAHPLDDNYDPNNWDGNGYRILMGSLGIKATAGDAQKLIDPGRTFDTVTNAPSGGINYSFSKYRVEVTQQPDFSLGPDPAANNPPQAVDRDHGYSIVDYNLENLYDYRDNPSSGCDFTGDTGCPKVAPFLAAVNPPYDYVPASDEAYQARLTDIATQIINDLHAPDILMLQEVEKQDFCKLDGGVMSCADGNADGQPDVLQDLALKVVELGGPEYAAAFDPDSSDLRGIAPAFMYRTDRVELLPAAGDPVLGSSPAIGSYTAVPYDSDVSNPKTLNALLPAGVTACETSWVFPRAPDVGLFRIYETSIGVGGYLDVYLIDNHFKSGPDTCVGHRTEQAKYNAALVAFIQAANPDANIVVGGDLNVYPEPDAVALGVPSQLDSLYDPALGLKNLWEVLLGQVPEAAYSYVYLGMAQTLDQMFVNQPLLSHLGQFRIAHINSDFPAEYPGDVARGTSDHDPNVANFVMFHWTGFFQPVDNLPELNIAKAGSGIPVKFSLDGDQGLDVFAAGYPQSKQIACDISEPTDAIEETAAAGSSGLSYDPTTDTYTYVWKTEKAWAGTCRQLSIKLVDGTFHLANFKFTK